MNITQIYQILEDNNLHNLFCPVYKNDLESLAIRGALLPIYLKSKTNYGVANSELMQLIRVLSSFNISISIASPKIFCAPLEIPKVTFVLWKE